jgi:fructokinase
MLHLGIDLGGTKIESALCGAAIDHPLWRKREATLTTGGPEALIGQLADRILQTQQEAGDGLTIGLGLPGSIDPASGMVRNCVMPWLDGIPLPQALAERAGQPVAVVNDAQAFALSEAHFGAGRGARTVLGVTIGTGVGGGWVIDGRLHSGRHGIAGEIGHFTLDRDGRACYCGRTGCVEQYLSGTALERRYEELSGLPLPLWDIAREAEHGNLDAETVMQELFAAFGQTIGSLINIYDPDVIVIGGGVSDVKGLFSDGIAAVARQAMAAPLTTRIVPAQLGAASGVFGAALVGAQAATNVY